MTPATIRRGSKGEDVKAWQQVLVKDPAPTTWVTAVGTSRQWPTDWLWPIKPDGDFGDRTQAATECWQARRGLIADGVVGPKTWARALGVSEPAPDPLPVPPVPVPAKEQILPVKRTAITMPDYVRAAVRGWKTLFDTIPLEQSVAVLWAQYMVETGGRACWNYNLGNVKHVKGDGHNYQMLNGVWEGVTPSAAKQLIASGQAVADANQDHAKAVGSKKVSVVFQPPHPATWFRAFASLDEGMLEHLQFLSKKFAPAWAAVVAGDPVAFANRLSDMHYFTASAKAYVVAMKGPFDALVASAAYEALVEDSEIMGVSIAMAEDVDASEMCLWDLSAELRKYAA